VTERRFEEGQEEPGDPLQKQEEDQPEEQDGPQEQDLGKKPVDGEPWAKTSSGDTD
jgi:hypothetical protein